MKSQDPQLVCEPEKQDGKKRNLLVCSFKIGSQPGKHVSEPMRLLLKGAYRAERPSMHKWLDAAGLGLIALTLAGLVFFLIPRHTPDLIVVDATVAPEEVITGGASTLTFRYENKSDETIRNARLMFSFPEHFDVEEITSEDSAEVGTQTFDLGEIAPSQYGFLHVRGTMFGDVGGEQIFTTTLDYDYGENQHDTKTIEHVFSPTASTLALELTLPEYLVAFQQVEGTITYANTGDVRFPNLTIEPNWPENFTLVSSSPALQSDGTYLVSGIDPGEEGVIEFIGRLGTDNDTLFTFKPSFTFDDTRYTQEILEDIVEILPPPLSLSHSVEESTLTPGGSTTINITYSNTSDEPLGDITLRVSSDTGILSTSGISGGSYSGGYYLFDLESDSLAAGEEGSASMTIPVRSSLSRSATSTYENISVATTSSATFTFTPDGEDISTNTFGNTETTPLTSPIVLGSFGRYWTDGGDQLGRGPVPPYVGETTKYWIFWSISGTTNDLSNLYIEADLGPNVTLTGRQSVSFGSSVSSSNGTVFWNVSEIAPTLPSGSTVVGAAFEVQITPTADQVGSTPTLLSSARVTAQDQFTGAFVSASSGSVTTSLPFDSKASAYGGVVEE